LVIDSMITFGAHSHVFWGVSKGVVWTTNTKTRIKQLWIEVKIRIKELWIKGEDQNKAITD